MFKASNLRSMSLVLALAALLFSVPAIAAKFDVIVVPDRQRMVNLTFDIQALRDAVLVTYRGNASSLTPLLHVWNSEGNAWSRVSPEDFAFGRFMSSQPRRIYLVGADSDLPPAVVEGASQASQLIRVDTLNTAEAANIFNKTMKFSVREWQALAERNGFKTSDLNYEQRKWGRYGAPGTHREPQSPASATTATPEESFAITEDTLNTEIPDTEAVAVIENVIEEVNPNQEASQPTIILDASTQQSLDPDEAPAVVPEPVVQDIELPPPATDVMLPEDK